MPSPPPSFTETRLPVKGIRSLVWEGDDLIDWVGGGQRHGLNGEVMERHVRYAYPFDAATSLPGSGFAVIYTRLGTKGLVLRDGAVVREINRSFYHADRYEYPIALFRLPCGRPVLAHCPHDYCRLEIEDLASGEILTQSDRRDPGDFFHSRLAASADGRHLLSAGWVWHPVDAVHVYDVEAALANPTHLDGRGIGIDAWGDDSCNAVFSGYDRLVVGVAMDEDREADAGGFEVRLFDLQRPGLPTVVRGAEEMGTLMPIGSDHLLGLYRYPRLVDIHTGLEVHRWPHINSGNQTSSILMSSSSFIPPIAWDPASQRCAIADDSGITVLQFGGPSP
jgi:hypothetical protein